MNQNQLEFDSAYCTSGSSVIIKKKNLFDKLGLVDFAFRFSEFSASLALWATEFSWGNCFGNSNYRSSVYMEIKFCGASRLSD